jgi:hypothetical protein
MMDTKTAWRFVLEIEERMGVNGGFRNEGFEIPLVADGSVWLSVRSGVEESALVVKANGREYTILSYHFNGNNWVLYNNVECQPRISDEVRVEMDTADPRGLEIRVYFASTLTHRWHQEDTHVGQLALSPISS